jgi:formylmethanofuran dehydrogenase subunit A
MYLKVSNGTVYDPASGVDGVVKDIWIQDGKVVAPPSEPEARPDKTIDATGLVVMPGGVDMHAHIARPKVNLARKMRPEDKRKAPVIRRTPFTRLGTTGSVPSTFATGYLYVGLGYTTAFDAVMFELPRYVVKAGEIVAEDGEIRQELYGKTLYVAPEYDKSDLPDIKKWFEPAYTIQFANYPVDESYLSNGGTKVECQKKG